MYQYSVPLFYRSCTELSSPQIVQRVTLARIATLKHFREIYWILDSRKNNEATFWKPTLILFFTKTALGLRMRYARFYSRFKLYFNSSFLSQSTTTDTVGKWLFARPRSLLYEQCKEGAINVLTAVGATFGIRSTCSILHKKGGM